MMGFEPTLSLQGGLSIRSSAKAGLVFDDTTAIGRLCRAAGLAGGCIELSGARAQVRAMRAVLYTTTCAVVLVIDAVGARPNK